VISGKTPARERPEETLTFNIAAPYAWDAPIMNWVYTWAKQRGVGHDFRFTSQRPGYFPGW